MRIAVVASGVECGRFLPEGLAQPGPFGAAGGAGGEQHAAPVGVGDLFGGSRNWSCLRQAKTTGRCHALRQAPP